jgi:hypothetical protein
VRFSRECDFSSCCKMVFERSMTCAGIPAIFAT